MTKYSLLIEDVTREELLEFLGSKQDVSTPPKSNDLPGERIIQAWKGKPQEEAKKPLCAHCNDPIIGEGVKAKYGRVFCSYFCMTRYDERKEKPQVPEIRCLIEGYLSHNIPVDMITSMLASEHDIHISPQQLGGYIGQIKKQAKIAEESKSKAMAAIEKCSKKSDAEYMTEGMNILIPGHGDKVPVVTKAEASQEKPIILPPKDKKATEAEIMTMYNKKHFTPSAIAQILELPIGEVEKVVWRRGPKT